MILALSRTQFATYEAMEPVRGAIEPIVRYVPDSAWFNGGYDEPEKRSGRCARPAQKACNESAI